jgi:hypothetical protein
MSRLIIIFALALAGAVTVLVLFANLLLVATNAGAQTTTFRDHGSTPASSHAAAAAQGAPQCCRENLGLLQFIRWRCSAHFHPNGR